MNEEVFHLHKLDVGEDAASCHPPDPSQEYTDFNGEEEAESSAVDEILGTNHSSRQHMDDEDNSEYVPGDNEQDVTSENVTEIFYHCSSNEDLNIGHPPSSSTPRMLTKEASDISVDKPPVIDNTLLTAVYGTNVDADRDSVSVASCGCSYHEDEECSHVAAATAEKRESLMIPGLIRVPIVGHETMEARSKFTVFKIHVMVDEDEVGWFIFRRYSDFVHLNDQLKVLFPSFRFILPPKRWLRSNFDADFLDERQKGLQTYVDNITGHRDVCNSKPVRDFFCFDDPPGPHDSLEESRAQCECMEEMVYLLRRELAEKDTEIELIKEELELYKNQVQLLSSRLSELNKLSTVDKLGSDKRQSLSGDGQFDADLLRAGNILLTNKLNTVTEVKTSESNSE